MSPAAESSRKPGGHATSAPRLRSRSAAVVLGGHRTPPDLTVGCARRCGVLVGGTAGIPRAQRSKLGLLGRRSGDEFTSVGAVPSPASALYRTKPASTAVPCVAIEGLEAAGCLSGSGGVVSGSTAARVGPEALAAVVETLTDGVMVFDADWTIGYVNPAGAALVGRPAAELTGRTLWIALPEEAGTTFHSFLLHARSAGAPVTWQGFYAPAGRWLTATAVLVGDLLRVSFRESADRLPEPAGEGAV